MKLDEARAAISRADFAEALRILEEIVTTDSSNSEIWRELGLCYLETRQPDLAIEALNRALRASPDDATAHFLLGHAQGSAGHLEAAAAAYRRALDIEPGHAKAEEFLIRTESLLESREHYRNGLKWLYQHEPGSADLNRSLRELMQSVAIFDGSPARDNLKECAGKLIALKHEVVVSARVTPETERWFRACERGFLCIDAKNWIGAADAYSEALDYRSQDDFVHHALGFCLLETSGPDAAVRAWLRTLELNSEYDFTGFGRISPEKKRGGKHQPG